MAIELRSFWRSTWLLAAVLWPARRNPVRLYAALSDRNTLCAERLYYNRGYWRGDPRDIDTACQALVDLMAETVDLGSSDDVLDVGFGCGDQDLRWVQGFGAQSIQGLDVSPDLVALARRRVDEAGLAGRIRLETGDACRLPFPEERFDVVFALESAVHFDTRERFFGEAFRVLRPGGRMCLCDFTGVEGRKGPEDRVKLWLGRTFWKIPKANLRPTPVLVGQLRRIGFTRVRAESIWHRGPAKFAAWARERLSSPELTKRLTPLYRWMLVSGLATKEGRPKTTDYVLFYAEKPS